METSQEPSRGAGDAREAGQDEDPSERGQSTGWASDAQARRGGQIGTGLLHNIEMRLGSIM